MGARMARPEMGIPNWVSAAVSQIYYEESRHVSLVDRQQQKAAYKDL
jgi:hypothetical protein